MHVLVIAPFHSGLAYISAAKERGLRVSVVTSKHEELVIPEAFKQQIDRLEVADDRETTSYVRLAQEIHKDNPVDGVVAGAEFFVSATAHVAHALGVPGLDPERVEVVRNKALMRQCLAEANIRAPRFARATNAVDLEQVVQSVGFPVVIKPLQLAASIGVVRADNPVELLAAYDDILHETIGMCGFVPDSEVLVEELLVGTEYCVDGYVTRDGAITVCELVKVELGPQPHFQEIGYTSYRAEDLPAAGVLTDYIKTVVKAVGITVGPFHSEVMLTDDGPVLIEIANRLPGDHLPQLTETATGVNFAAVALAAAVGMPIPEPATPAAQVGASQYITASELAGRAYKTLDGWETLKAMPEVDAATIEVEAGTVLPMEEDARARIAEVRYHADSVANADAFRAKVLETVHVRP